jgi:hypothetical protein
MVLIIYLQNNKGIRALLYNLTCVIAVLFLLSACNNQQKSVQKSPDSIKVKIVNTENGYQLFRNGKPYYIKGAGGYSNFAELKKRGGNSIRVWDTNDAGRILDKAEELGLTVCLGIWMTREKEGFDYDDKRAVQRQLDQIRREVIKYKDHPALLMWNIGNELDAKATNVRVWDAVNDVAKMIHELDPNHPTATSVFHVHKRTIRHIKDRCPEIDLITINTYGGLNSLPEDIRKADWNGPYIVSEYGGKGDWETPYTSWKQPIEQTSSQKAYFMMENYKKSVEGDSSHCLGAYAFLWGYKQEQTHTWFSFFSENGEKTEMVDVAQYLWTGQWPENRAPRVLNLYINGELVGHDGAILKPNSYHTAEIIAYDDENDSLFYHWEVLPEVLLKDGAVDLLKKPAPVKGSVLNPEDAVIQWKTPDKEGDYRLFVYVYDGQNNMGTANFSFRVKGRDFMDEGKLLGLQRISSIFTVKKAPNRSQNRKVKTENYKH